MIAESAAVAWLARLFATPNDQLVNVLEQARQEFPELQQDALLARAQELSLSIEFGSYSAARLEELRQELADVLAQVTP